MNTSEAPFDPVELIRRRFSEAGLELRGVERRDYPEEIIFIARTDQLSTPVATSLANEIDRELADRGIKAFVTVRSAETETTTTHGPLKRGVADPRSRSLVNLVTARARTSEAQPSLAYIPDSAETISTAVTPRHHLIFGRRGAGKTALMLETRRLIEEGDNLSLWVNLQTYRRESADRTFAWVCQQLCERVQSHYAGRQITPHILTLVAPLRDQLERFTSSPESSDAHNFIPKMHALIRRFVEISAVRLFIFLDDFHYLPRNDQPKLLDMLHAMVRDGDAWLKIAGIKHLSRWFQLHPPTGLQTGHDADEINLDVTLEDPFHAKVFLERVLGRYAENVGIPSLSAVFSGQALDRLVLASGGVPRDYLVLSARAVREAQGRENARIVGVQDVNKAAGEAAKAKIDELEDDAASDEKIAAAIVKGLQMVRTFCIEEKSCTYFRVDFRERETCSAEYGIIQDLMDLRLFHLVESSLSDEREAGRRSEVYTLDLSQFSGQRLKRRLKVLDFISGHIVLKETGTTKAVRAGETPKQRLGILRRGPLLELKGLQTIVAGVGGA